MMSQRVKICTFDDLATLKMLLYPESQLDEEVLVDEDYDNRWSWDPKPNISESVKTTVKTNENMWLLRTHMSISPIGDLLVFASGHKLTVYKIKKSDIDEPTLLCSTSLIGLNSDEIITCVLCLPFASHQRSNPGSIDWNCVILGFSSGLVRMYTESGHMLLSQLFHNEPVKSIKCQTFSSQAAMGRTENTSQSDLLDEVLIVYSTIIVALDGFPFFQTLRSCRNYLARRQSESLTTSNSDFSVTLTHKKWTMDVRKLCDCNSIPSLPTTTFDHLVSESVSRGPIGSPANKLTTANAFLSTGDMPYTGLYKYFNNESQVNLTEMAQAVISKVKNFIPLFGQSKIEEAANEKIESAIDVKLHLGLYDKNREGSRVCLSPCKSLAAISDEYGRVILLCVKSMIALRMWKGYRDAQLGWTEVSQDEANVKSKKALFLVIYAPRRGLLEIWRSQHGSRVGAFNVGKYCVLMYCNYKMIGLNSHILTQLSSAIKLHDFSSSCYLFDAANASLYRIDVPFLAALSEPSDQLDRDQLLLSGIKSVNDTAPCDLASIICSMRSIKVRNECINHILQNEDIDNIKSVVDNVKNILMANVENMEVESQLFIQTCCKIAKLCQLYEYCKSRWTELDSISSVCVDINPPDDLEDFATCLGWSGTDVARSLSLFTLRHSVLGNYFNVHKSYISWLDFFKSFTIFSDEVCKLDGEVSCSNIAIELDPNSPANIISSLASFIYLPNFIHGDANFNSQLTNSWVKLTDLIVLAYKSWLTCDVSLSWYHWKNFCNTVRSLASSNDMCANKNDATIQDDTHVSGCWNSVCQLILNSTNQPAAIVASICTKSIAVNVTDFFARKDISIDEWETLSLTEEKLSFFGKQLEDVFLLELLLKSSKVGREKLKKDISLEKLLKNSSGIVTELVSEWVVVSSLKPQLVMEVSNDEKEGSNDLNDLDIGVDIVAEEKDLEEETIKELFVQVRRCFPFGLDSDVLIVNCAWESLNRWIKEPSVGNKLFFTQSLQYLDNSHSSVLKHNVACLMWKTFMQKRFESLANLMEKMGRIPKDRICKKDIDMGEDCLDSFVNYCHDLLDLILQSIMTAEVEPVPVFNVDDWWRHSSRTSSSPLVVIAIQQKISNLSLINEHYHLAVIIKFIVMFQVKSCRPLSLFSSATRHYLFKDFNTSSYVESPSDEPLNEIRTKCLINLIASLVQSIEVNDESTHDGTMNSSKSRHYSRANKLFGELIGLSREWKLDTDELRRKFVSELYSSGCDSFAVEVLSTVSERPLLGTEILKIAGIRYLNIVTGVKQMSALKPKVAFWLQSLNADGNHCRMLSIDKLTVLLENAISCLMNGNPQLEIAYELLASLKSHQTRK